MSLHKTSKIHASSDVVYYCLYGYFFLGERKSKLAKTFNKNKSTISRWIKQYRDNGFYSRTETQKLAKFNEGHRNWLLNLYNKNPTIYLHEAKIHFIRKFQVPISASSIFRILHQAGYSWKTLERRAIQVREDDITRFFFEMSSIQWDLSALIFLDEESFDNKGMLRNKGYGVKGERLVHIGEFVRKPRISLLCFLGQSGLQASYLTEGTFTRHIFFDYRRDFALSNKLYTFKLLRAMAFGIFKDSTYEWQKDFGVSNLMARQVFVMQLNGQWPIDFEKYLPAYLSFLSTPLTIFYSIFWSFMALHIGVFFFIAFVIKLNSDDSTIPEMSTAFTQSVIYGFALFLAVYFQLNHKDMAKMISFVIENFKMRSAKGLTYVTIEPCYRLANVFTIAWTISCVTAVSYNVLLPMVLQVRELPLPCWYPFDYYSHPIFEIVYFSQFIGQMEVAITFGTFDIILISMVIFISSQYDVLFCSLKNIRYTALLINSITKHRVEMKKVQNCLNFEDEEENQYYYSFEQKENLDDTEGLAHALKELQSNLKKNCSYARSRDAFLMEFHNELEVALRDCITHHQNLINICAMLERFYNPIVLVKSLQVTLQICNLAYVSTKATSSLLQNINYVEYLAITLFDLMLFGYAGNWIQQQSTRVGDALLRSPWYLCSGSFRRSLIIILTNTFTPLKLTGGKFFILDYTKVIAVVKASFSFYTLLQNLG